MKITFFIGLILFIGGIGSCTSPDDETVNYSDISPNGKQHDYHEEKDSVKTERPDESAFLTLADTLLPDAGWIKWDSLLFPDRFGASSSEKWILKTEKDSMVLLNYTFKDSLKTKNAFFNWIDCFGPKCTSYSIGDNIRVKGKYAYFLVGEKQLMYLEGLHKMNEKTLRASFYPKPKNENWIYLVQMTPTGKAVWKRIVKGEEQPIIREDAYSQ